MTTARDAMNAYMEIEELLRDVFNACEVDGEGDPDDPGRVTERNLDTLFAYLRTQTGS